jgi:hypothetical protein
MSSRTRVTACANRSAAITSWPRAGIHQTSQPVTHHRGSRPFSGEALLIDGQLFSSLLPNDLRDLLSSTISLR